MTKPIGYKSPPTHSQWKKGQSGNPHGRAKGQRNFMTDLAAALREVIHLNEGGRPRQMTKQQALIASLLNRAITGNDRAAALIINTRQRYEDPESTEPVNTGLGPDDAAILEAFVTKQQPQAQPQEPPEPQSQPRPRPRPEEGQP